MKQLLRQIDLNFSFKLKTPKILIIESDDWGSLRSNRKFVESTYWTEYPRFAQSSYLSKDCLEQADDLKELFGLLKSFKDSYGNHPVITANTVMTNPDFKKIKDASFKAYFYEPFVETLERRDGNNSTFDLYREGEAMNIFIPQFHGKEHVNVPMWLDLLRDDKMFQGAFEFGVWGISKDVRHDLNQSIQATLDTSFNVAKNSIIIGLDLFEKIFGYRSQSFIANNFVWDPELNPVLNEKGVKFLQGAKYQLLPLYGSNKRRYIRHRFGERNEYNQIFGIRNCSLEITEGLATVESCLKEISIAFLMKKPAIISMHRLNFMGGIDPSNRDQGLYALNKLLSKVLKKWPDVCFMSTPDFNKYLRSKEV